MTKTKYLTKHRCKGWVRLIELSGDAAIVPLPVGETMTYSVRDNFDNEVAQGEVTLSAAYGSDPHDVVSTVLLDNLFAQDPQAAGEWANALPDPKIRQHALELLQRKWREFGEETATQQLRALGLNPEDLRAQP